MMVINGDPFAERKNGMSLVKKRDELTKKTVLTEKRD